MDPEQPEGVSRVDALGGAAAGDVNREKGKKSRARCCREGVDAFPVPVDSAFAGIVGRTICRHASLARTNRQVGGA